MPRSGGPLLAAAMLGLAAWQAAFINAPPNGSSRGRPWQPTAPRAAKTLAAANTGTESHLWVQVKGGRPTKYPTDGFEDVGDLLEAVYVKVERRLPAGVGVDQLKLYLSKEAVVNGEEALRPGLRLDQLEGGMDDLNPLFVDYQIGGASVSEVFDELKASGKNPIFISFNGDTIMHRLAYEKPLETMLRAIAAALMREKPGSTDEADTVRCDKLVLKDFLKDRDNVVLLVDELNFLLKPSDTDDYEDVGLFLRQTFLDPAGRHLLFSTHIPTSAGINKLLGKGSGSPRDANAVEMPKSYNVTELRGMHEKCEALTPCEAAYYSYIPSLIYTVKTQPSYDFKARFRDTSKPTASAELIASFLADFFSGHRLDDGGHIRAFDSLTESPGRGQVRWVLGYAGLLCEYLGEVDIARWIDKLPDLAEKVESGQDWEEIVRIALALRCIQAKFAQPHPLLMLPKGAPRPAAVFLETVPTEHCKRPEDMLAWWKTHSVRTYPYIAVLSPSYAKTEVIDVMWVYQESEESEYVVRGIQDKLSKKLPDEDMPEGMHGLLFRGQAPDKATEPQKRRRWTYPGSADICDFLGASLEPIYPARWPVSAC